MQPEQQAPQPGPSNEAGGGRSEALNWISDRPVPLDFGGPEAVPYEPLPLDEHELDGLGWFDRNVARFPRKIAIQDDRVALTYSEVLDRLNGLTRVIATETPEGCVVATIMHNGPAAAVAMLAVRSAGRILVPIDAGHPLERQAAIFKCSNASAIVIEAAGGADVGYVPSWIERLFLDLAQSTGVATKDALRSSLPGPYVAFTSGSTGSPKGLVHQPAPQAIARMIDKYHLRPDDVFISLASMSQTGLADLVALAAGATLHVVDMKRRGIMEVLRVMEQEGVTFLSFVPSVLRPMLALPGIEQAVRAMRVVDLHGEAISKGDLELLRRTLPEGCCISVTYGSTEAGAVFSWFVRDEAIEGAIAPLGYLAIGKSVALVDEDGRASPEGAVGELIVRGPMALGSWENGRVSDARFTVDANDPSQKVYGMGDLVRQRADGLFEFCGRRDRRTKIRGLWIDLSEVEQALRAGESVRDAVAMISGGEAAGDKIVAFVVPAEGVNTPSSADLRRMVAAATAEHMAPNDIRYIDHIPRLPNYKPDLVKLAAMLG